jgi:hypothetical protein
MRPIIVPSDRRLPWRGGLHQQRRMLQDDCSACDGRMGAGFFAAESAVCDEGATGCD